MQASARGADLQILVRPDDGLSPPVLLRPIDLEHVVAEGRPEGQILFRGHDFGRLRPNNL